MSENYQTEATRLSLSLEELENRLQGMPVSDAHKRYEGRDDEPGQGLAIQRVDSRWVLHHIKWKLEELDTYEEVDPFSSLRHFGRIARRQRPYLRENRKPLLSCNIDIKSWAAKHIRDFVEHAMSVHRNRLQRVNDANDVLGDLSWLADGEGK